MAAVGVQPAGRSEHHRAASGWTAVRVRRGVWPWPIGHPAVGLYLDNRGVDAATEKGGAEESTRRFDGIDRKLVSAHPTDSARDP